MPYSSYFRCSVPLNLQFNKSMNENSGRHHLAGKSYAVKRSNTHRYRPGRDYVSGVVVQHVLYRYTYILMYQNNIEKPYANDDSISDALISV